MRPSFKGFVATAVAIASVSVSATSAETTTCTLLPAELVTLPPDFGIDQCIGSNSGDLLNVLFAPNSKCSLDQLMAMANSKPLQGLLAFFTDVMEAPDKISASLYKYMQATGDSQMKAFCSDWSKLVSPCAEALVPLLMSKAKADPTCCGQVNDAISMLNLFVPPNINKESFILSDLINGVNELLCAKRADIKQTCGSSIFRQLKAKYTAKNFRLLNSVLLPFFTAVHGEECNAFQGLAYTSSASQKAAAKAIDYSCCVDHMRPLLNSVLSSFEFVSGNTAFEFLNGIVEFSNSSTQFVDALNNAKSCQYKTTCSAPAGLTNFSPREVTPGTNRPKTNELADTQCTQTQKCDVSGKICSIICEKGSVQVPTWLNQTLEYQRQLAYQGPMCLAQLPATHNSAITLADGFGTRDQLMNLNLDPTKPYLFMKTNNQLLSLTDQLNVGIRWLEVDTHYFLDALRSAHCSGLGTSVMESFFAVIKEELQVYGSILYDPDLLGCFPSLSGIRAEEQPTTKQTLEEIRAWLDKLENQNELVFVYFDTGKTIETLKKGGDLNAIAKDVLGDLLVPIEQLDALKAAGWKGSDASLQHFIDQGHRVVLLANDNTGLAYKLKDYCGGHEELSTKYLDALPDASRTLGGEKIYSGEHILRSYQSSIRYIMLDGDGEYTSTLAPVLTPDNVGKFVRWDVNLVAPDDLDVAMMHSQVWSWAVNEPSTGVSNAKAAITSQDGRWRVVSSPTRKACWSTSNLKWTTVEASAECPEAYVFAAPQDPYQNYLLQVELVVEGISSPVAINVDLHSDEPTLTPSPSEPVIETPGPSDPVLVIPSPADGTPNPSEPVVESPSPPEPVMIPSPSEPTVTPSSSEPKPTEPVTLAPSPSDPLTATSGPIEPVVVVTDPVLLPPSPSEPVVETPKSTDPVVVTPSPLVSSSPPRRLCD